MSASEDYVAALADRLRGPAIYTHRVLGEVEAHLQDARDALVDGGWAPDAAEREAIARFGDLKAVAAGFNRDAPAGGAALTLRALVGAAGLLVGVGLLTVGLSAVASYALSLITSAQQVFGPPPHASMPAASCAHWLAVQPAASTCASAAALEARDDLTMYLGALGVIGAVILALALVLRTRALPAAALSPLLVPTVAVTMFAGAAVALAVLGATDARIGNTWGQGMWYVQSACALMAAAVAAFPLLRSFRGAAAAPRAAV
jgi:hypothetical protein